MKTPKPVILFGVLVAVIVAIYFLSGFGPRVGGLAGIVTVEPRIAPELAATATSTLARAAAEKAKKFELAKEITTPDGFINTDAGKPITIGELVGKKVILIDFWTYSCINCQRTTPYLNAWYDKYEGKGLVIIGVHTPEFGFEKNYDNVKAAVEKEGIKFPVVLDNDFSTWRAYKNQFWPRKYLIDIDGYVVYDRIGEGGYEETEQKIQAALTERLAVLAEGGSVEMPLTEEIPLPVGVKSPETYFGSARNEFFGNGTQGVARPQRGLVIPATTRENTLYLSGDWNITPEFAENTSAGAGFLYRYTAKDFYFVAAAGDGVGDGVGDRGGDGDSGGSTGPAPEIDVEVRRDGKPLGAEAGEDIVRTADGKTIVKIKEARLYKIVEDKQSGAHALEFVILKPGLKAFTFTFG